MGTVVAVRRDFLYEVELIICTILSSFVFVRSFFFFFLESEGEARERSEWL